MGTKFQTSKGFKAVILITALGFLLTLMIFIFKPKTANAMQFPDNPGFEPVPTYDWYCPWCNTHSNNSTISLEEHQKNHCTYEFLNDEKNIHYIGKNKFPVQNLPFMDNSKNKIGIYTIDTAFGRNANPLLYTFKACDEPMTVCLTLFDTELPETTSIEVCTTDNYQGLSVSKNGSYSFNLEPNKEYGLFIMNRHITDKNIKSSIQLSLFKGKNVYPYEPQGGWYNYYKDEYFNTDMQQAKDEGIKIGYDKATEEIKQVGTFFPNVIGGTVTPILDTLKAINIWGISLLDIIVGIGTTFLVLAVIKAVLK